MEGQILSPAYANLYNGYESFIKAKNFKAGKGYVYQTPVKEFLIWLERHGITKIKEVTSREMLGYYQYLIERPNQRRSGSLAGRTIKLHLFSISLFLDNLLSLREIDKAFFIPRFGGDDQKPRNFLNVDEVKCLYQYCENLLDKSLLAVAYGCGLRRSELENLNMSDVQLHSGILIVRKGKGSKRREVPMSDNVLESVKKYVLDYRYQQLTERQTEQAFFINRKGNRMSGEMLNKTLKKIIQRTQNQNIINKEITLHCLRHSIANHLMENNAGIDFIRGFLGHSFIDTAYIYAVKNKRRTSALIC
ncbi:MAG: integrase [Flavobacterium sp.]|nr:MAG: integrase [Flavobacterium sp.]